MKLLFSIEYVTHWGEELRVMLTLVDQKGRQKEAAAGQQHACHASFPSSGRCGDMANRAGVSSRRVQAA